MQRPDSSQSLSLRSKAAKLLSIMPVDRSIGGPSTPMGSPLESPYSPSGFVEFGDRISSTSSSSFPSPPPNDNPLSFIAHRQNSNVSTASGSENYTSHLSTGWPTRRGSAMAHALRHFSSLSMDLTNSQFARQQRQQQQQQLRSQRQAQNQEQLSNNQESLQNLQPQPQHTSPVQRQKSLGEELTSNSPDVPRPRCSSYPKIERRNSGNQNTGINTNIDTSCNSEPSEEDVERRRREVLDLEIKSLRQECEQVKLGNEKADTVLRNMSTVLSRIKELASCQPIDVAVKLRNQADDLEAIFTSAIENLRSVSPSPDPSPEDTSVSSKTHRQSFYGGGLPRQEIESSGSTIVVEPPSPERSSFSKGYEYLYDNYNFDDNSMTTPSANEDGASRESNTLHAPESEGSGCHSNAAINRPESIEIRTPFNIALKDALLEDALKEDEKLMRDTDGGQLDEDEEEGCFCYIEGSAQRAAPAQRPISRAQANRHSAIIGDSLFSLWAFDEDKGQEHHITLSQPASPKTTNARMNDIIPSEPVKQRTACQPTFSRGYAIAVTKPRGRITTCERPSENSPTVTCKVDLDGVQGGRYVRQRFASTKMIARSSLAAYQGRSLM